MLDAFSNRAHASPKVNYRMYRLAGKCSMGGMERTFYTDLGIDECMQRLAESGWANARPERWQPAASDHKVLRAVDGHDFRLAHRFTEAHISPQLGIRSPPPGTFAGA